MARPIDPYPSTATRESARRPPLGAARPQWPCEANRVVDARAATRSSARAPAQQSRRRARHGRCTAARPRAEGSRRSPSHAGGQRLHDRPGTAATKSRSSIARGRCGSPAPPARGRHRGGGVGPVPHDVLDPGPRNQPPTREPRTAPRRSRVLQEGKVGREVGALATRAQGPAPGLGAGAPAGGHREPRGRRSRRPRAGCRGCARPGIALHRGVRRHPHLDGLPGARDSRTARKCFTNSRVCSSVRGEAASAEATSSAGARRSRAGTQPA